MSCEVAYVILILMFAGLAFVMYVGAKAKSQAQQRQMDSWATVRSAIDRFDFDKAYGTAQRIVSRYPSNYYGHTFLGSISVATGRFHDAEHHYRRAYEMLPSEENEKMLQAVRRRLGREPSRHQAATK